MRWGQQEGDRALNDTAIILQRTFRQSDIVARVGGDEFVVLTIGAGGKETEKITARLGRNLLNHNATRNRDYKLSISFCTLYYDPQKPRSIDELLAHANNAE